MTGYGLLHLLLGRDARAFHGGHPAVGIQRVAASTQQDYRMIGLGHALDAFDQTGRRSDADDQDPGGQWVQRPRMANLDPRQERSDPIDNLAGRDPGRLMKIQDSNHGPAPPVSALWKILPRL